MAGQGVKCRALNSGKIKNRRGVNVPNSKVWRKRIGTGMGLLSYACAHSGVRTQTVHRRHSN